MEQNLSQSSGNRPTHLYRKVLLGLALLSALGILGRNFTRRTEASVLPILDFVEYWAAGRLCLTNGNPYSWKAMLELEKSVGMKPAHSPTTGEEYVVPTSAWNDTGPQGAGYYRETPGGGAELLNVEPHLTKASFPYPGTPTLAHVMTAK